MAALASSLGVQHLIKKIYQGANLLIKVDATSTCWAWRKGSKIMGLNTPIKEALTMTSKKNIFVQAEHIPGPTNTRADWLSRHADPKNYRLNPEVFKMVCKHFHTIPTVDLFASRKNRQTQKFCSWREDPKSLGNAWELDWGRHSPVWLNPPWEMVHRALIKLKEDKGRALCCLPRWPAAPWWPLLQDMLQNKPIILKDLPLYQDPEGKNMPSPRWATLFGQLKG